MKNLLIIGISLLILISGASLVFANFITLGEKVVFLDASSGGVFTDSEELKSVLVSFKSDIDISNKRITSVCTSRTHFIQRSEQIYYFNLEISKKCRNKSFSFELPTGIKNDSLFYVNSQDSADIFSLIIDYPTTQIVKLKKNIDSQIIKLEKKYSKNTVSSKSFESIKNLRAIKELQYKKAIIISIINARSSRYSVPVKGYAIATGLNVIPNAARHYREGYTDGIHHGWDIMAPKGTPVSAIDNGVIVRIVRGFSYEDIANIKKGDNIEELDRLRNLDILRGNQVWLKTSKGDVMFYSHLDSIPEDLQEEQLVSVGTNLGTIGITGVPDKNYTNYHLHFAIHKNPYTKKANTSYNYEDYMRWDWYLKGLSADEVLQQQQDIFRDEVEFTTHEGHDH